MVSILLNLAYCNEAVARSFKFDSDSLSGFIRNKTIRGSQKLKSMGSRFIGDDDFP